MAGQRKRNNYALVATVQDYKQVFSSQAGQRVLNNLIDFCGIINVSPSNDTNSEFTAKGMRNVAKYILVKMRTNESDLIQRLDEIEEKRKRDGHA